MFNDKTDLEIARWLRDAKYIDGPHYQVWLDAKNGVSIYSMRVPNYMRPGKFLYRSTLCDWVQEVNKAIADARMIEKPEDMPRDRFAFRHTVAESHDTHLAGDPTPQRQRPDHQSSWNPEQMISYGKLDRSSRKR